MILAPRPGGARRRSLAIALGLLLGTTGGAIDGHAQEKPPEFPSAVEVVTVDVVVKDKKGNPVSGLSRAEFTLLEDGRPQTLTSFEEVSGLRPLGLQEADDDAAPEATSAGGHVPGFRLARTFVILFDEVHLTALQARQARRALETFLKGSLRDGDRVRIVAVGSWEFEGPTEEALEEVRRLEGLRMPESGPEAMTDYEAMRIERFDDRMLMLRVIERIAVQTSGRRPSDREGERITNVAAEDLDFKNLDEGYVKALAKGVYNDAVRRNETTLQALEATLGKLRDVRGRKSLILVSPGFIQDPSLEGFRHVVEAATRVNAAIYFLDARSLEIIPGEAAEHGVMLASIDSGLALASQAMESQGAEGLAADTGGFSVKNRNDLASGFRQISTETRSYYLLGYSPRPAKVDGEFRKIEVKVVRKGLDVRSRKGYYASLPGAAPRTNTAGDGDGPGGREISLRVTSFVFGDVGAGRLRTLVAAEADLKSLALESRGGLLHGNLDLVIDVTRTGGGSPDRFIQQVEVSLTPERRRALEGRGLPFARELELPPGSYEARIALNDRKSGRVGAASHRFEVPEAEFRVSTPILSDVMEPGASAGRDTPALGTRRRFRANGTLYFQFEVYGAQADAATGEPTVLSAWAIRDRSGTEWAGAQPSRLENSARRVPGRLGQVDLTFPPGDYTLVLEARDASSARKVEVHEPFTIEPDRP